MVTVEQRNQYHTIREEQRKWSRRLGKNGYEERLVALALLKDMLAKHEARWLEALRQDLGKPAVEAFASEIGVLLNEIDYVARHLKAWMKPTVNKRLLLTGLEKTVTSSYPYGSVLVLAPWNYPLQLALMPVIGALAAGNSVVLKPSEYAPATSELLAELVPLYFEPERLYVVEGDGEVAEALTEMDWDFIFFTGSEQTGKKVYAAAAKNLTPVLLELGGKNPCIVDESGLTTETIKQIAWGKLLNAGQSCIAPDTVYVPREYVDYFLEEIVKQIQAFYGDNAQTSPYYGRIIHQKEFHRLVDYLDEGDIHYGGHYSQADLYISPTLMVNVEGDSTLRQEEIFGPILPVIAYDSLEEVIDLLQDRSVPLVVYAFSQKEETLQRLEHELESGSFSINQVITHATSPHLPFGGKGASGMGRYHGKASFEAFSYLRTVYSRKTPFSLEQQYPPYFATALVALRKLRNKIF